jgi:PhzF family phenazine biosynthesis protein
MAVRPYLQLDVFAERAGDGNPLGVVVDADGLDAAAMQAFAAWTNLSETIFFLPRDAGADYRIRIFTPRSELPFAGHPSVGAGWATLELGLVPEGTTRLVQGCGAGLLPVRCSGEGPSRRVHVRSPRAQPVATPPTIAPLLQAALAGAARGALAPAAWNNGPTWWLVELRDAAAVRTLQPDLAAIAALTVASGAVGLAVFGTSDAGDGIRFAVRAFCPADNIPEDPVTGSANACIAAALHAGGRLARGDRYVASQGRELGRDGRIEVEVDGDGEVWIGGATQAVIRGHVDW